MKLIIQIPCLNEEEQLPATLADLPRQVPGFDHVEWLIVDDGSTDATVEVARAHGVEHIVRLPQNRGLAAAFQAGLDAALKLGADVVVNTDADNQYRASDIARLVAPIVEGDADLVIGDRQVRFIDEFSPTKKRLQHLGSWVVRRASGTQVPDTTSGFRAYSREAALQVTVVNRYTYTIESIIQAGKNLSAVGTVPIGTNPKTRDSRLFRSNLSYIRRNALTIVRVFAAYAPLRFFGTIGAVLMLLAGVCFIPFFADWILNGERGGHVQSLVAGAIFAIMGFQTLVLAVLADLVGSHRIVSQRVLERVRRIELALDVPPSHYEAAQPARHPGPSPEGPADASERPAGSPDPQARVRSGVERVDVP